MKLHFFGTVSGLWQLPDRNHQSMAFEVNGAMYVFDAGACCSRTIQLMRLDLLRIKKVVISHCHMDHIGGLGNLFWDIRKQRGWLNKPSRFGEVELYIPEIKTWEGWLNILSWTEENFKGMSVIASQVEDGVLFEDENMKVTAYHNEHLKPVDGKWKSFSYLIEAEGKRIVYTGDILSYSELDKIDGIEGCDALIAETGHHDYMDVCDYAQEKKVKNLFYTHIGRSIMVDYERAIANVRHHYDGNAMICEDASTVEF